MRLVTEAAYTRAIRRCRTRKGLGISSRSGSQTATGSSPLDLRSAPMRSRNALLGLTFSPVLGMTIALMGRPPARACWSSTRVRPRMLFLAATLLKPSSEWLFFLPSEFRRVKPPPCRCLRLTTRLPSEAFLQC